MKIEIALSCIDDGRVPRHRVFNWEIKGNQSRDVRMRRVHEAIVAMLKAEFPKPGKQASADGGASKGVTR